MILATNLRNTPQQDARAAQDLFKCAEQDQQSSSVEGAMDMLEQSAEVRAKKAPMKPLTVYPY